MNKVLVYATVIISISIFAQICFAAQTSIGTQAGPIVSVEPSCLKVVAGENFTVNITVDPNGNKIAAADYILSFDNTLLNATSLTQGTFFGGFDTMTYGEGINNTTGTVDYGESIWPVGEEGVTNPGTFTTITFQTIAEEHGVSELRFEKVTLSNPGGIGFSNVTSNNGTVVIEANVFDTKVPANPYPSIMGTHHGVIIPDRNITVNMIYTYPCPGTGGHSENVLIWNETTGDSAEAHWEGYTGDYHNLSFSRTITLKQDVIYNYTIETGSYPQIIHVHSEEYNVTGGKIRCDEFRDANGKVHANWIPAFRLWRQVE